MLQLTISVGIGFWEGESLGFEALPVFERSGSGTLCRVEQFSVSSESGPTPRFSCRCKRVMSVQRYR